MGVYENINGSQIPIASNLRFRNVSLENFVTEEELLQGLANKNDVFQYETIPTASADLVNTIVQYIGTTTVNYTNGYFYKCVSDGAVTPTYSWVEVINGGDMLTSVYDPNGTVVDAGGIVDYLNDNFIQLNLIHDISEYESEGVVNVKDYGAVGDGVTDDSNAFISALSENERIWIPKGIYNLNHIDITLSSFKSFVGESNSFVTILNSNITAPYGISCKDITFDGGTTGIIRQLDTSDGHQYSGLRTNIYENTIALNVTPYIDNSSSTNTVSNNIIYENCVFKNVGTASLAYQNSYGGYVKIGIDTVVNCTFKDLICAGIYHMSNITTAYYLDNTFKNIGRNTDIEDNIVALKSGDTSNQTDRGVDYCVIKGNKFENIISAIDTTAEAHTGEVNMITVQGERVTIINNSFNQLSGYGHDREGIYLKAHYSEIANNYFENAGLGEGYICCKRRTKIPDSETFYEDANVDIHDNTIIGDYGCAIKVYHGATIHNNNISILTAKNLIHAGASHDCDISIYDNDMQCGMSYPVVIDDTTINDYYDNLDSNDKIVVSPIRIYDFSNVYMDKNHISLKNSISSSMISNSSKPRIVGIQRIDENIVMVGNILYSATSVYGVIVNSTNTYTNNLYVVFENNTNDTRNSLLYVSMNGSTSSYQNISKQFIIRNNNVKHRTNLFDVNIDVGEDNADTLIFDTQNRITTSSDNNYIYTNVAYIDVPDETWVKAY